MSLLVRYLQMADNAVVLGSIQATGGGSGQVHSPSNQKVPSGGVTASLRAAVRARREVLSRRAESWRWRVGQRIRVIINLQVLNGAKCYLFNGV